MRKKNRSATKKETEYFEDINPYIKKTVKKVTIYDNRKNIKNQEISQSNTTESDDTSEHSAYQSSEYYSDNQSSKSRKSDNNRSKRSPNESESDFVRSVHLSECPVINAPIVFGSDNQSSKSRKSDSNRSKRPPNDLINDFGSNNSEEKIFLVGNNDRNYTSDNQSRKSRKSDNSRSKRSSDGSESDFEGFSSISRPDESDYRPNNSEEKIFLVSGDSDSEEDRVAPNPSNNYNSDNNLSIVPGMSSRRKVRKSRSLFNEDIIQPTRRSRRNSDSGLESKPLYKPIAFENFIPDLEQIIRDDADNAAEQGFHKLFFNFRDITKKIDEHIKDMKKLYDKTYPINLNNVHVYRLESFEQSAKDSNELVNILYFFDVVFKLISEIRKNAFLLTKMTVNANHCQNENLSIKDIINDIKREKFQSKYTSQDALIILPNLWDYIAKQCKIREVDCMCIIQKEILDFFKISVTLSKNYMSLYIPIRDNILYRYQQTNGYPFIPNSCVQDQNSNCVKNITDSIYYTLEGLKRLICFYQSSDISKLHLFAKSNKQYENMLITLYESNGQKLDKRQTCDIIDKIFTTSLKFALSETNDNKKTLLEFIRKMTKIYPNSCGFLYQWIVFNRQVESFKKDFEQVKENNLSEPDTRLYKHRMNIIGLTWILLQWIGFSHFKIFKVTGESHNNIIDIPFSKRGSEYSKNDTVPINKSVSNNTVNRYVSHGSTNSHISHHKTVKEFMSDAGKRNHSDSDDDDDVKSIYSSKTEHIPENIPLFNDISEKEVDNNEFKMGFGWMHMSLLKTFNPTYIQKEREANMSFFSRNIYSRNPTFMDGLKYLIKSYKDTVPILNEKIRNGSVVNSTDAITFMGFRELDSLINYINFFDSMGCILAYTLTLENIGERYRFHDIYFVNFLRQKDVMIQFSKYFNAVEEGVKRNDNEQSLIETVARLASLTISIKNTLFTSFKVYKENAKETQTLRTLLDKGLCKIGMFNCEEEKNSTAFKDIMNGLITIICSPNEEAQKDEYVVKIDKNVRKQIYSVVSYVLDKNTKSPIKNSEFCKRVHEAWEKIQKTIPTEVMNLDFSEFVSISKRKYGRIVNTTIENIGIHTRLDKSKLNELFSLPSDIRKESKYSVVLMLLFLRAVYELGSFFD